VDATISEALTRAKTRLCALNIDSASLDAELLLSHALGIRRIDLIIERHRRLTRGEADEFALLLDRRARKEPVAYITGVKEFFGREFKVNPAVLIPRPETEILVEQAVTLAPQGGRVLEVGVGSGAVIISVLCERQDLRGFGNDLSRAALRTAGDNALMHGVSGRLGLFRGDTLESSAARWPLIIANPPYVAMDDMGILEDDVRLYEPPSALFGGKDGLDIVKGIINALDHALAPGGALIMEVGLGQKDAVEAAVSSRGLIRVRSWIQDLAGIERVVIIERTHG